MKTKLYISSKTVTKTSALLLPALGVDIKSVYDASMVNAFLKDLTAPKEFIGERLIYCLFDFNSDNDIYAEFLEELQGYSSYIGMYKTTDDKTMVVFQIPEEWNEVYDHFVSGEYTKIPRNYVKKYFKPRLYDGQDRYGISRWKASKNFMVLTGDEIIRKQIERDLEVEIPEGAEVFSKPNTNEYYGGQTEGSRYY